MKGKTLFAAMAFVLFAGCYDPIEDNNQSEDNTGGDQSGNTTQLSVSLFTSSSAGLYPAVLLVFDETGDRIQDAILTEETPTATLTLNRGKYRLAALSGTSQYTFPKQYSLESVISVPDAGYSSQPLLMGQAELTLSAASVTARLQMKVQTASISLQIDSLPSDAQQVQAVFSDIYTGINLRGSYSQTQSVTFDCQPQNGSWQTGELFIFPSAGNNAVISIACQTPDSTLCYCYNLTYPLLAGYAYQIRPAGEVGIGIGDIQIDAGNGNTEKADTLWVDQIRTAPFLADGHVVAWIENEEEDQCDVLLISLNEWEDVASAYSETGAGQAADIAAGYSEGGNQRELTGWSIPSKDDAALLKTAYAPYACVPLNNILTEAGGTAIGLTTDKGENIRYLCNEAQHTFTLASATGSITKAGSKTAYRLRLVRRVRLSVR